LKLASQALRVPGEGEQVLDSDSTGVETPTEAPTEDVSGATTRPRRRAAGRPAGPPAAGGLMFQAPDTTLLPALPRDDRADDPEDDAGDDRGQGDDADNGSADGAPRRKRSRGGRRRRKSDDGEPNDKSDKAEKAADDESDADGDADSGEGNGTRRRRRRARAGESADVSPDDPDNTVVKVREGRTAEDEITGVAGSTRLEAKKQRRREGREAGRRRAPIVSEAEFLARRESVKREMVVRQHSAGSSGAGSSGGGDDYTQIVVLEDGVLVEHYVARESQTSLIGNVYLGKVQNVLPSMEAAFIDIGAGRNAVLYAGEVDWSTLGNGKARKIEEVLEPGQSVLVQVSKDPIGQKGARLTSQISIPGRFLVYVPGGQVNGISRKLPENERNRLKTLLKEVLPEDAGVIVRTAAEGATEEQLTRDVTGLTARWEDIVKKTEASKAPQQLYAEPDLVIKVVRDLFNEDFASLIIDGADAWDNINGYISHVAPDLAERVTRWEKPAGEKSATDAFTAYRIDEQIQKALDRKVWLPSGGSLVIDRTEAMTVVDVNTGKFTGSGGNLEETVTKNNLEAAEEIVRQLRLRDIGGIIVIDFIDMVLESNRDLVLRRLVECLGRDRTRHQVAEVTSLGLVQMTRKRIGTGLLESFSHDCEACKGRGVVVTTAPVEPAKEESRQPARNRRGGRGRGAKPQGQEQGQDQDSGADQAVEPPAERTDDQPAEPSEEAVDNTVVAEAAENAEASVVDAVDVDVTSNDSSESDSAGADLLGDEATS
jgi:ribonuclease E